MNNKGFMMAEVVVVSAIILVFMAGMYVSYNKVFSAYNTRIDYYDINTLYKLGYYKQILIDNGNISLNENDEPLSIYSNTGETVYLFYNNNKNIEDSLMNKFNNSNVNLTFKDYVKYLSTAIDLTNTKYVLLMEKCSSNSSGKYTENCKYAYLEVSES